MQRRFITVLCAAAWLFPFSHAKADLLPDEADPLPDACANDYPDGAWFLSEVMGENAEDFASYPEDMQCLLQTAAQCEHFAGEDGYDEDRQKFLHAAVNKYCAETITQANALKEKYKADARFAKLLRLLCGEGQACQY
jgi:hypothetical protein